MKTKNKDNVPVEKIGEGLMIVTPYKKPLVCLFDFDKQAIEAARNARFSVHDSSLGSPVLMPQGNRYGRTLFLLNHNWPSNIHEYDIFVVDMASGETLKYNEEDHKRVYQTNEFSPYFIIESPQTVFDGRAISGKVLRDELGNIVDREHIVIAFASQKQEFSYKIIKSEIHNYDPYSGSASHDNYSFIGSSYHSKNITGNEMEVCVHHPELNNLLSSCKHLMSYEATFYHPTTYNGGVRESDLNFVPLMRNNNKDIISYIKADENRITFVFPQMIEKEKLLIPLLENILPAIKPKIFPESTLFSWKKEQDYWLPNHAELLAQKKKLEQKFQSQINDIDTKIESNLSEFAFLHNLISETDDELVKAVIHYFQWLDFTNVIAMDNDNNIREEDIQVVFNDGLLIVECKGIGGTSKDSDCSQISKIKHRRCRERNKFDVSALYLVNHQRYLPPKSRKNPPFSEHQITDAQNDERGLLTTWELFNAYFMVQAGIIDKCHIRTRLLSYGLVSFAPDEQQYLGQVTEVLKNGLVIILSLDGMIINKNDVLIVRHGCDYQKVIVLNIQLDGNDVETANSGEVGLLIDKPIKRKSKIYLSEK